MDLYDEKFINEAIIEAEKAYDEGEIPVGCVIVRDGKIIGRGHNLREQQSDPTAHAEIIALRDAGRNIGDWHLDGATAYITLEPCPMCAAALILARVEKIVYCIANNELGACGSVWDFPDDPAFSSHPIVIRHNIDSYKTLLNKYFKNLRETKR